MRRLAAYRRPLPADAQALSTLLNGDVVGEGVGGPFADAPRYYPRNVTHSSREATRGFRFIAASWNAKFAMRNALFAVFVTRSSPLCEKLGSLLMGSIILFNASGGKPPTATPQALRQQKLRSEHRGGAALKGCKRSRAIGSRFAACIDHACGVPRRLRRAACIATRARSLAMFPHYTSPDGLETTSRNSQERGTCSFWVEPAVSICIAGCVRLNKACDNCCELPLSAFSCIASTLRTRCGADFMNSDREFHCVTSV
jgi:hypothetical protein